MGRLRTKHVAAESGGTAEVPFGTLSRMSGHLQDVASRGRFRPPGEVVYSRGRCCAACQECNWLGSGAENAPVKGLGSINLRYISAALIWGAEFDAVGTTPQLRKRPFLGRHRPANEFANV